MNSIEVEERAEQLEAMTRRLIGLVSAEAAAVQAHRLSAATEVKLHELPPEPSTELSAGPTAAKPRKRRRGRFCVPCSRRLTTYS